MTSCTCGLQEQDLRVENKVRNCSNNDKDKIMMMAMVMIIIHCLLLVICAIRPGQGTIQMPFSFR